MSSVSQMTPKAHQTCVSSVRPSRSSSLSVSSAHAKFSGAGTNLSVLQVSVSPIQKAQESKAKKDKWACCPTWPHPSVNFQATNGSQRSSVLFGKWHQDGQQRPSHVRLHIKRLKQHFRGLLSFLSRFRLWKLKNTTLDSIHYRTLDSVVKKQPASLRTAATALTTAVSEVSAKLQGSYIIFWFKKIEDLFPPWALHCKTANNFREMTLLFWRHFYGIS